MVDEATSGGNAPKWITAEPRRRKRHLGLWLGIPGGLLVVAAVAASLVLIAPGVSVAGAQVSWRTQGVAQQTIDSRVAHAQIRVGDATLSGSQLGASVDAQALARQAIGAYPLWNIGAWNPKPISGVVTIDPDVAMPALRQAAPQLFTAATDAQVAFDKTTGKFAAVDAKPGLGVDVKALAASLSSALNTDGGPITIDAKQAEVQPATTTAAAEAFAAKLNQQADTAGFYLQGKRVESVPLATVASWLSIKADPASGDFVVTPDQAAIQATVAGLPAKVDQKATNEQVVVNSAGTHLRVLQAGKDGYGITSTTGLAAQVGSSLTNGDFTFAMQGQVEKYQTTNIFRRIEVDKSAGAVYLYQGSTPADAKRVYSFPIAIGTGGSHETQDGHFTVYEQLATQDMGDCDGHNYGFGYCQPDVPWVTYFNGNQALHGAYWRNTFGPGIRVSHGCVNMRVPDAEVLYHFAQVGTEVWVHE